MDSTLCSLYTWTSWNVVYKKDITALYQEAYNMHK